LVVAVREYEQAEISRFLTQGLGAVELVPTGRPFIKAAPNHWRVTSFKRALLGLGQGWSPQCESRPAEAHEWGVLKVGCVNGTSFDANENKALPPPLEPDLTCVLRKGDVLVSRANTRELVGLAALVEEEHPNLLICDKLYRLQLRPEWVTAEFTVLLLRSDVSRRQIELGASGASSSMQNISQDVIRELLVAFPPLNEQQEIVTKAGQVRESCNLLVSHCEEHIARLREYRSSLISAAVTGQLDIEADEAVA
ncbi:MAG: restriction endonuclease subunit S, partial [Ruthenibacterium sp.]